MNDTSASWRDDWILSLARFKQRFVGVSYEKRSKVYRARLYCKGRHINLGRFATAEMAAWAHDRAVLFVHGGGRAVTNFEYSATLNDMGLLAFKHGTASKLAGIREAVQRDAEKDGTISEWRAREIRHVAAAIAFFAKGCPQRRINTSLASITVLAAVRIPDNLLASLESGTS
jgi:hypothetical protein